jgi:antitoxin (DNA-binding transcriptional repressor) of toxin-antitoxin stability system
LAQISLTEAQEHLPEIIAGLQPGEAVQIIQGDRAIARLIVESLKVRQPRKPGSEIGSLTILAEDQAHLDGFEDYIPSNSPLMLR